MKRKKSGQGTDGVTDRDREEDREPTQKVLTAQCRRHARIYVVDEGCGRCQQESDLAQEMAAAVKSKVPV